MLISPPRGIAGADQRSVQGGLGGWVDKPCPPLSSNPPHHDSDAAREARSMFNITIPDVSPVHRSSIWTRRKRRIWGNVNIGLSLPGTYYFLTLTSSPQSPDSITHSWDLLLKRLHRRGYKFDYYGVRTNEGHGVLHVVIRIRKGQMRLKIDEIRRMWVELHAAPQMRIEKIRKKTEMSNYMTQPDCRARAPISWEMSKQNHIISTFRSRWWLGPGWRQVSKPIWQLVYGGEMSNEKVYKLFERHWNLCMSGQFVSSDWAYQVSQLPSILTSSVRVKKD